MVRSSVMMEPRLPDWVLKSELANDHLIGVGHRVLHGGTYHNWPAVIDERVATVIEKLIPHACINHNLAPIRRLLDQAPDLPQVAASTLLSIPQAGSRPALRVARRAT
jgi:acetate kinase